MTIDQNISEIDVNSPVDTDDEGVGEYSFKIALNVHSPELLFASAVKQEGATPAALRDDAEGVNVEECLKMILDPSVIAGGEIISSSANPVFGNEGDYDVEVSIRVSNTHELLAAASAHPDAAEDDEALSQDGVVDVRACIQLLLDPGYIDGCSVHESSVSSDEW